MLFPRLHTSGQSGNGLRLIAAGLERSF